MGKATIETRDKSEQAAKNPLGSMVENMMQSGAMDDIMKNMAGASGSQGGAPDLQSMAQQMMSGPQGANMMNMAQQMMSGPQGANMMQMAQQMMSGPQGANLMN